MSSMNDVDGVLPVIRLCRGQGNGVNEACLVTATSMVIEQVDDVMRGLKPVKSHDMTFINGDYTIQQDADAVIKTREALVKLSLGYVVMRSTIPYAAETWSNEQWYKYFADVNCKPVLANAWLRFWCIDSSYREWGQVYYATREQVI